VSTRRKLLALWLSRVPPSNGSHLEASDSLPHDSSTPSYNGSSGGVRSRQRRICPCLDPRQQAPPSCSQASPWKQSPGQHPVPFPLDVAVLWRIRRPTAPLLVSLLDGSVAAVDEVSGRKLWTYNTGTPLVSNKASLFVAQS